MGDVPTTSEAGRFVADTEHLERLTSRLCNLRTRQAKLASCFERSCAAQLDEAVTATDIDRARRLDAVLVRLEQRRDETLAEAAALLARLEPSS